ncbi:CocE/NonD family hydrolase [Ktedonospora formicarum]|uniref:Hydrolase n=1 Tax=Ktedonospora formicarum TaxID=2778364 RepID=A0A8J3MPF0_9CHLR|nr:CocE/NonD family hydrolase [Ktedonospora formicarum]GHO42850.1 hydrolase [Ktedonospora formicarum]
MIVVNPNEMRIKFNMHVPMRDGVTLSADLYFPASDLEWPQPRPLILLRTPYMKTSRSSYEMASYFVARGYCFMAVDVRGRGDSDGVFTPYFSEGRDGYDIIEWCASQPWCDGAVGTIGASYEGCIQWLTALEQPPHLKAMVVLVPPSEPLVETPTGTPSPMNICWLHYVSGRINQPMEMVNWESLYTHLPLLTMDEQVGHQIPYWRESVKHAQVDEYWLPLCYQRRFEQVDVPVLHISGWYDDEQIGTPLNFIGMTTRGASPEARTNQRLLMGPWGHASNRDSKLGEVDFGSQAIIDLRGEQVRWFDRWVRDLPLEREAPVRIFVMGANTWRSEQEWPLARTQWTPYYLHSGGRANSRFGDGSLSLQASITEPCDHYDYDPANPVPFVSDSTSAQIGGPDDYSAVERRDDVLVYATAPLTSDVEVTGPVRVELYAASSAPDTDFTAKLIDVWPNGFRQRLCDSIVRARFRDGVDQPSLIEPERVYHYTIDCWNTSQLFKKGHCICLEISSSAFPKYDRNLNTGAPLGLTTEMVTAHQRIYHDTEHLSALILPIIPIP